MPYVDSNGARIHWDSDGEGTPVLLIMGHLYSSRLWYPLLSALRVKHRAIWFDNRGTGDSDTTDNVTIEKLAADALAVLDAAGIDKAHVYGVSMGGGIAAEFAMRYPERTLSVTLGCTMLKTTAGQRKGGRAALIYRLPLWLVRTLLYKTMTPARYGSAAPRDAALNDIAVLKQDRFTMRGVRQQAQAKITMPVLVLHGDEDEAVPVESGREIAEILPHAKYVEFKGAGHNYLVANNEGSTTAFLNFIDEVDRSQGVS